MTTYKLPDLPYDFGALEPHISGQIVELHHGRHHKAYVTGANENMQKLQEARGKNDFAAIGWLERALAFNVSGHILHSIYWQNMKKGGGGEPSGDLASAITRDFGSLATLKTQMNKAAMATMGSGWSALVFDPACKRLGTTLIHDHQHDGRECRSW
jgi:Fe-Mn family superoxide dismutase